MRWFRNNPGALDNQVSGFGGFGLARACSGCSQRGEQGSESRHCNQGAESVLGGPEPVFEIAKSKLFDFNGRLIAICGIVAFAVSALVAGRTWRGIVLPIYGIGLSCLSFLMPWHGLP
jgi:hypothetical protein